MGLEKLNRILQAQLKELDHTGTSKRRESVITGIKPAANGFGPRYLLAGQGNKEFLRMNSNSYLGLAMHPAVISAEEKAAREYGAGPGAVRFISGTCQPHVELEERLALFHNREGAMIFSAAYAAVMGILPQLITPLTVVLSDQLNHNSIINAIRLAKPAAKAIYRHLDMADLEDQIKALAGKGERLVVVTDGIFSMRGDHAPLDRIDAICRTYEKHFSEGIITVVDDSHGVGAFGKTGRGTEEYTDTRADVLVATLGKSLGVNGGYVAADVAVIDYLRERSPFYVYSNPITPSEAAAARKGLEILDSAEGQQLLDHLRTLTKHLEDGLVQAGYEILAGDHPIVPIMVCDTQKTAALVSHLFEQGILVTGLNFPVVPKGDEEIRLQVSASHTEKDIEYVLSALGLKMDG